MPSKSHKPQKRTARIEKRHNSRDYSSSTETSDNSSDSSSGAPQEFEQIYDRASYQKLLRDYKELYQANEALEKSESELSGLLEQVQKLQLQYAQQHELEAGEQQKSQQALSQQIQELMADKFEQLQQDIEAHEAQKHQLESQNSLLQSELTDVQKSQKLKISDLTGQFSKQQSNIEQLNAQIQQYQQQILAYEVLTGVYLSKDGKTFDKIPVQKTQIKFSIGDASNITSFVGKLGFTSQKAAIECVRAPECSQKQLFQDGVQCTTEELWVIFGQMCAALAEREISE